VTARRKTLDQDPGYQQPATLDSRRRPQFLVVALAAILALVGVGCSGGDQPELVAVTEAPVVEAMADATPTAVVAPTPALAPTPAPAVVPAATPVADLPAV